MFLLVLLVPLYVGAEDLSLRGLHATDDTVVVVGGNQGVIGFSLDAGVHWIFSQLPAHLYNESALGLKGKSL